MDAAELALAQARKLLEAISNPSLAAPITPAVDHYQGLNDEELEAKLNEQVTPASHVEYDLNKGMVFDGVFLTMWQMNEDQATIWSEACTKRNMAERAYEQEEAERNKAELIRRHNENKEAEALATKEKNDARVAAMWAEAEKAHTSNKSFSAAPVPQIPAEDDHVTLPLHKADRSSTAHRGRMAAPDADLAALPVDMSLEVTLDTFASLANAADGYNYVAKHSKTGNKDFAAVLYDATMKYLKNAVEFHQLHRWVYTRPDLVMPLKKAWATIDDAISRYNTTKREYKTRANRVRLSQADRDIGLNVSLLNPMMLSVSDLEIAGSNTRIAEYRLGRHNVARRRGDYNIYKVVVNMDGKEKKAGRTGVAYPISALTKGQYFQTYECHAKGHDRDPLYKYHALVWGRALYYDTLLRRDFDLCPLYGVPTNDYVNNGPFWMTEHNGLDIRYLQLAELDWMGMLAGMGAWRPNAGASQKITLPTYEPDRYDHTQEDYAKNKVTFTYVPAHLRTGWVGYMPNNDKVERTRLGWHILNEKVKLGLMRQEDIADLGIGPKYTTNDNGHTVPIKGEEAREAFSPSAKVQRIKTLNEACSAIDVDALVRRQEIWRDFKRTKDPLSM